MSALAVATGPADREMDDLDLVAGVRAGEDRAFEILFLRYQPRVAAYVRGMVRDRGRAEDITQEVFMSALRRLREDDREILFRPWIHEIAKNKCIDAYRRGRNTTEVSFDAHDQVGAAEHGRLAEPGPTPDAAVEGKLAFDSLRGAFGGLSPVHHDILVMREFEGLSYREIGERLGMSRPAVESTLFRARKRLGEEYEELVSGKRCQRVQSIVVQTGAREGGLRDQRRVARHLAHCQPCRRYAHLAGCDVGDLVRRSPSLPTRVAAFLPLPAFLRRRGSATEEVGPILTHQASRPVAQWTAHVAGAVDPGIVSSWTKVAVAAATVALAGSSAVQHRAPAAPSPPHAAATAVDEQGRPAVPRHVTAGALLPAANGSRSVAGAPAPGAAHPGGAAAGGSTAAQAGPGNASQPGDADRALDPQRTLGDVPQEPLGPVGGTAGSTLAPVLNAVGGAARGSELPVGSSGDGPGGLVPRPDRVLGGVVAPAQGAASNVTGTLPAGDAAGGAQGALNAPGGTAEGVVGTASGAQRDGGAAANAAPTGLGGSVLPRVSDSLTNPTAAPTTLGG